MEVDPTNMIEAFQAGLRQAGELAVTYSFSILGAVLLLIAGFIVARWVEKWSYRAFGQIRGFDETLKRFLSKVLRYGVLILVLVTVLAQFGVQTASIIAALGAAGLAIGLALQGTLQNIAAGIMLLVLKPFRVGEFITAGNVTGTIVEIGLFATEVQMLDGVYVLAPNSELWNTPVTNYTRNPRRRNDLTIGIGYGDDIDLAKKLLLDLAKNDDRVLGDPPPEAFVVALGDNSVNITARYWTMTTDWWQTRLDLTQAGKLAFDANGISIPFPQRDIHYYPIESKKAPSAKAPSKSAAKRK
ncbi:MAG: mechanosensitive ion channel [Rhizobiaceae bacterium]|nr:mechanosensitive ion channel [Rhizobiaceae bacterium]